MRKSIKVLLTTIVLTVACVSPVFATEKSLDAELKMMNKHRDNLSNAITTLVSYDNNCDANAKVAMHTLLDGIHSDIVKYSIAEKENYIKYLKAIVGNAIETERIKKGNVAALTDLVKVNPSFQSQLDAAVIEYNKAVEARMAAENAIVEARIIFEEDKVQAIAKRESIASKDSDVIK